MKMRCPYCGQSVATREEMIPSQIESHDNGLKECPGSLVWVYTEPQLEWNTFTGEGWGSSPSGPQDLPGFDFEERLKSYQSEITRLRTECLKLREEVSALTRVCIEAREGPGPYPGKRYVVRFEGYSSTESYPIYLEAARAVRRLAGLSPSPGEPHERLAAAPPRPPSPESERFGGAVREAFRKAAELGSPGEEPDV